MPTQSFLLREYFHLSVLRLLSLRLSDRVYAVKGGICLRLFHGSPRLSEDMNLDAAPGIRPDTLAKNVDAILNGGALMGHLASHGVTGLRGTKPKQTDVTQRWKIVLEMPEGKVGTKIEFSRLASKLSFTEGVPSSEILLAHGSVPFAARYYDAAEMIRQKTLALAAPSRNAARDLFDLHHLIHFRQTSAESLKALDANILRAAVEKIGAFSFGDFNAQVIPYLTDEMIGAYRAPSAFQSLQGRVREVLEEALR